MQKPKSGRALFDLMGRDGEEVEEVVQRGARWPVQRHGESEARKPAPDPPLRLLDGSAAEGSRVLVIEGRRAQITLTPITGAVALFLLLVVVAAFFAVGRRSGFAAGVQAGFQEGRSSYAAEAVSEIEAARAGPPASELVADLRAPTIGVEPAPRAADARNAGVTANAPVDRPRWIRGYTYVLAQEFLPDHGDDALAAQVFLAEHGISTTAVRMPGGRVQLISTQGFNFDDEAQKKSANELLTKLHNVGAKYHRSGGGYKLEGYFKTLKSDHW